MEPSFASPFSKGGSRGILIGYILSENQNPPPRRPLGRGEIRKVLRLRHSLERRGPEVLGKKLDSGSPASRGTAGMAKRGT